MAILRDVLECVRKSVFKAIKCKSKFIPLSTAQLAESGSGGLMEQRKPGTECIPKKMGVYIIHELKRNGKP